MRKRNAVLGAGALLVAMFGGCAVGAGTASNTAQPPTPTKTIRATTPGPTVTRTVPGPTVTVHAKAAPAPKAPSSAVVPGDSGTLRVGKDIKPGTYVTKGNGENSFCTWTRYGADGQVADVGVVTGQAVVTIEAADTKFETNGCHDWTRE